MKQKIKQMLNPIDTKKAYKKYVQKFREKFVPKKYNQIYLMDNLLDDDIDHYISISNRTDGKSFNYFHFLLKLAVDHDIRTCFVVRHFTVRESIVKILQKIIDTFDHFDYQDFIFRNGNFYISLIYRDRIIAVITDLNQATDLKYLSNFLEDYPIIAYDEFLALESDYLPDEWERLKTIYSSIDRKEERKYINIPKILYLGNAVNFSSPVLANLDLFNILENHTMDTKKKYDNILLETNRNENANEQRNLRAFKEENDSMTHAEFSVNKHHIATDKQRNEIKQNYDYFYIKLKNDFLRVTYNKENFKILIAIANHQKTYQYNMYLVDNTSKSLYLDEKFYDLEHDRKYIRGLYLFDNMYTKEQVFNGFNNLSELNIIKIAKHHYTNNKLDNFDQTEKIYKDNYIENTKISLYNRFFL